MRGIFLRSFMPLFALWLFVHLSLAFGQVPKLPVGPAEPAAAAAEKAAASETELLLKTLEDPKEREKLVRQLRALIERERLEAGARPTKDAAPESVTFVQVYERLLGGFERVVRGASANLRAIPKSVNDTLVRLKERDAVLALADALWKIAVALFLAIILARVVRRYAVRPGERIPVIAESSRGRKFLVSSARSILGLLPPAAVLLVVFIALTFLRPAPLGAAVVLTAVWAYFFRKVLMAGARILIAPDRPAARWPDLRDETAAYWNIWLKRLTGYGVYGYYAVRIIQTLGAPRAWIDALFGLYGAGWVIQGIALILQQRKGVRSLLTPDRGAETGFWRAAWVGWTVLAAYWHAIAIAYLVVAYGLWGLDYPHALSLMVRASLSTLFLAALCIVARYFLGVLLGKLFRVPERVAKRFPGLDARVNRYIRILHVAVFTILYVLTGILILEAWGVNFFALLFSDLGVRVMVRIFAIGVALAIAAAAIEAGNFAAEAILQPRLGRGGQTIAPAARLKTLVPLGRTTLKIAVIVVAVLVLMDQVGISITPILAGVGILGLAVGFGAQSLVKDIISGLFILLEDSISVGDVVILKGTGGLVENINLRTIRMRDLSGNVHVIPHSSVDMITNMTKDYSRYLLEVGVAYREDSDQVVEVLKEIGAEMQADSVYGPDMLAPIEILGVDRFEDSAVIIRARLTTKPIKQWNVGREFNRRMKKAFDERGIEIPFPHRTIFFGEPKQGTPPPLYMEQVARAFEKRND